ncbi:MAG: porin Gram-negative type, partial [Halothiobacillaceae bacterium]
MNKRLIAIAVAGALALPAAATAGVEIYGKARMSLDFVSNDDPTLVDGEGSAKENEDSAMSVTSNASRLGFKGSEDLGGGLSAIWQIENSVDMDNGGIENDRNTFLGLTGDWGTALAGRHDTPYKMSTGKLDIFVDTRADYNGAKTDVETDGGVEALSGPMRLDVRSDNAIAYVSPDMSGFSFAAAYVTDYKNDDLPQVKDKDNSAVSVMGAYNNGPFFVTLAYESLSELGFEKTSASKPDDIEGTKLGASYTLFD